MPDPVLASDLIEWNPACTLEQLTISVVLITVAVKMKNYLYTYRVNPEARCLGERERVENVDRDGSGDPRRHLAWTWSSRLCFELVGVREKAEGQVLE